MLPAAEEGFGRWWLRAAKPAVTSLSNFEQHAWRLKISCKYLDVHQGPCETEMCSDRVTPKTLLPNASMI